MRVFVAGGAGVIGERLVSRLTGAGHEVAAATRSEGKAARLADLGAKPVIMDGLDAMAGGEAVGRAGHVRVRSAGRPSRRLAARVEGRAAVGDERAHAGDRSSLRVAVRPGWDGWPPGRRSRR